MRHGHPDLTPGGGAAKPVAPPPGRPRRAALHVVEAGDRVVEAIVDLPSAGSYVTVIPICR